MKALVRHRALAVLASTLLACAAPQAQAPAAAPPAAAPSVAAAPVVKGITPPPDYVVGPEDVLAIVFWRERELSADVIVRPDGKISLPLLNDIEVAGLTPDQIRERVVE